MSQQHIDIKTIELSSGQHMPLVGLGTWDTANDTDNFIAAVKHAIKIGYRHIDTAWLYGCEGTLGQALQEAIAESSGTLKREDLFIVSKVWNTHHSPDLARKCLKETLENLRTDYVDLYLIHWPMGFKENAGNFPRDEQGNGLYSDIHYLDTYKTLEELYREGKIKSIGISNFNIAQVQDVLDHCEIKPVNNQIELHPYRQSPKLVEFCQKNNIVVTAYAPIGANKATTTVENLKPLLQNDLIVSLAAKYNKTPAQICLRWGVRINVPVLPKSVKPERLYENANVFDFEISDEDMEAIKGLDRGYRFYQFEE